MKVALDRETLSFSGKSGDNAYAFDLEFNSPIKKDSSKYSTKRLVEFYLVKEEEGTWPSLQKSGKLSYVKVDWNKWADSDDEGEKGDFDLSGMGDMDFGDMMGGGGMDDMDSDDEDLPDLEPADGSAEEAK